MGGVGLRKVIAKDLEHGFYRARQPPPSEHRQQSRRILEITLLRHRATRARADAEFIMGKVPVSATELDVLVESLLDILNGDWKKPYIEHFCWRIGCCGDGQVSVCAEIVFALLEKIAGSLSPQTPSVSKWHTFAAA
jgi:hypothetical protein